MKKFVGNSLRASSYKVKTLECYRVQGDKIVTVPHYLLDTIDSDDELSSPGPLAPPVAGILNILSHPMDSAPDPVVSGHLENVPDTSSHELVISSDILVLLGSPFH